MRLDKYLSNSTGLSRSIIKRQIRQGKASVNSTVVINAGQHVNDDDQIALAGQSVNAPSARYFMLFKPEGVVSATKDSEHPTAIDYVDEPRPEALQIAGRLDIDATGLLLITDDGQWNHKITSPKHHCIKTYYVELAEPVLESEQPHWQEKFGQGVWLENENRRTLPATVKFLDCDSLELSISEGKYHQVKRMCATMGNRVEVLHRQSIGQILLDPQLAPGEYRPLSDDEVGSIV